ncbi:MAG TPA: amino acid adenylation domain-containing protein [Myxococcaceae bacterium]|jgi:amino acid adenylation domain-containing protein
MTVSVDYRGLKLTLEGPATKEAILEAYRRQRRSRAPRFNLREAALSPAQAQVLLHERLASSGHAYVVPLSFEVEGACDAEALRAAVDDVIRRHGPLRLRVESAQDGTLTQRFTELEGPVCELHDLSTVPEADRQRAIHELESRTWNRPIDVSRQLPCRFVLCRLGLNLLHLLGAVHHLAFDARSVDVFQRDLLGSYTARLSGKPAQLPELRRDYLDFVRWLEERGADGDFQQAAAAMDKQLDGAPSAMELPPDRVRPSEVVFAGSAVRRRFRDETWAQVRTLAQSHGVTPFCVLAAGLGCVLGRASGQPDAVLGTPLLGRADPALMELIGFFVNTLPLRVRCDGDKPFSQLVREVADSQRELLSLSDYPLASYMAERPVAREPGRTPLFQTLVTYREAPVPSQAQGLVLRTRTVPPAQAKFEISFSFEAEGSRLEAISDFQTALFEHGTVEQLLRQVEHFLAQAAARPEVPVSELPMTTEEEARELVTAYNRANRPNARAVGIHRLFEECVDAGPQRTAVKDAEGTWTYRDVEALANGVAEHLRKQGVKRGECVLLMGDKGVRTISAMIGIMKLGAVYVPVEPADPARRRQAIAETCRARFLLYSRSLKVQADETGLTAFELEGLPRSEQRLSESVDPAEPVNVLFTSGSTGTPKGVLLPHVGLLRLVRDTNFCQLRAEDVTLQISPFNFDGHTFEVWATLCNGGSLVIVDKATVLSAREFSAILERERVTILVIITALLNRLIEETPDSLRGLRKIVFGGEIVSKSHIARAVALCGPTVLVHTYGPTECSFTSCHNVVAEVRDDEPTIPIGLPVSNTDIYVLDERLRPVPLGTVGDVYLSGDGLALCYLGDEERTRKAFIPNPFAYDAATQRMYRTGDRARRRRDGRIEFIGRIDNQIKIRSQRVELGEVEATLSRHPGVKAAFITFRDANGSKELLGYYVAADSVAPVSEESVRSHLSQHLPDYMVPTHLIAVPGFPLKPNGKVDKARLPAPVARERTAVAPESDLEEKLAAAWKTVLQRSTVGVTDNFFEAGGHSLLLVRLQKLVETSTGRSIPITDFFRHPTIRAMARALAPPGGAERPAAEPVPAAPSVLTRVEDDAIAIVGMAIQAPGARSPDDFWENVAAGRELIERFGLEQVPEPLRSTFAQASQPWVGAGGILEDTGSFDYELFGITPGEAEGMDPQHRVFFETAWAAIEDSACDFEKVRGAMSVYAGCSPNRTMRDLSQATEGADALRTSVLSQPTFLATRFAYKLDLGGEGVMVDTACSTALVATHLAARALLAGDCDYALAGAVSLQQPQRSGYLYFPNYILSPDGRCRPFDRRANGTVPGSGCVAVLLRRLSDAVRDGDPIHAVIRGSAINNDGASKIGYTAPSEEGQVRVIQRALSRARLRASDISYVETHGTGTALGDPIEFAALRRVFQDVSAQQRCALGAVKASIGHLGPAAGGAGLVKAVLSLKARKLAPTVHFEEPNAQIQLQGTPFHLPRQAMDWEVPQGTRRRAGVSSFGIGGTNAHLIVEEAP